MTYRSTSAIAALSAAGILVVGAIVALANASTGDAVSKLAGRWAGQGRMVPASGPVENFKCVVTYIPAGDGVRMQQNLRCNSPNYRLDAATLLQVQGNRVTGRWVDRVYSLDGTVNGKVTADGFDVMLQGQFFQARMAVAGSGCEQSVRVSPHNANYIREISASLKRC